MTTARPRAAGTGTDRPTSPGAALAVLCLAGLSFALAQTAIAPALAELGRSLHHSTADVTWVITAYFISAAVYTPVLGRLGDLWGKRRVLVWTLVLFSIGSAVSALAPSLTLVILGRVLQGAGGGIFPLAFGLVRDVMPRERVAGALGTVSALTGAGAGLGLLLGGVVSDAFGFRFVFWAGAVPALVSAFLVKRVLSGDEVRAKGTVDVLGAGALAFGLALPLLALSQGSRWGWAQPSTLGLVLLGVLSMAAFARRSLRVRSPLVDLHLLGQPVVLRTNVATLLVGVALYVPFLVTPAIAQAPTSTGYGLGLDGTGAGLLLVPGCLLGLGAGPLTGLLVRRFGSKVPMAVGALISAVGLAAMAVEHNSVGSLLILGSITALGTSLSFSAMPNLIIEAVPPDQTGQSTGINSVVRTVGVAVGSQITAVLLSTLVTDGTDLPTQAALAAAFLVGAGAAVAACAVTLRIPSRGEDSQDVLSYIGAASPLAEPALPGEHR